MVANSKNVIDAVTAGISNGRKCDVSKAGENDLLDVIFLVNADDMNCRFSVK
jgi:hypothetical protein